MSKIKSNQITSRAHKGTLVIGDTHDKVQFHHEAEVFIPGYATKEYVDDVAGNVMPHENPVFHLNDTELFVDYQIPSGKNAGTFGPLVTDANVNVPDGSTWTIVGEDDTTAHAGYLRDLLDTDIPMVPNDDSFLHYDVYTDKWKPKTLTSISGNDGDDGEDGEDGASAYEIAVENGFVGTEQEWLDSLKGEQGDSLDYDNLTPEQIEALKGEKGDDGLSAYEVAVKDGFTGTEALWLASLKGDKGDAGEDGEDGSDGSDFTYDDLTPEQIEAIKGEDGQDGQDGKDFTYDDFTPEQIEGLKGDTGDTGEDGKGWKSDGTGYSSSTGKVTFASDDGLGFETGDLRGEKGSPGDGIHVKGSVDDRSELPDSGNEVGDAYINNSDGDLYIWGDDGAWHDAGHVVGPPGPEGEDAYEVWEHTHPGETEAAFIEDITGEKGDPFTYDDFTPDQLEDLKGEAGGQGEDGLSAYEVAAKNGYPENEAEWLNSLKGEKGEDGEDGEDGVGFEYDDLTPEQIESLKGEQGDTGANSYEFWLQSNPGGTEAEYWESLKGDKGDKGDDLTFDDLTPEQLAGLKGEKGDTGKGQNVSVGDVTTVDPKVDGTHGDASITTNDKLTTEQNLVLDFAIPAGDTGLEGLPGPSGDSAYTVAINNGFKGTEEEWLESLKGDDGDDAAGYVPEFNGGNVALSKEVNDDNAYVLGDESHQTKFRVPGIKLEADSNQWGQCKLLLDDWEVNKSSINTQSGLKWSGSMGIFNIDNDYKWTKDETLRPSGEYDEASKTLTFYLDAHQTPGITISLSPNDKYSSAENIVFDIERLLPGESFTYDIQVNSEKDVAVTWKMNGKYESQRDIWIDSNSPPLTLPNTGGYEIITYVGRITKFVSGKYFYEDLTQGGGGGYTGGDLHVDGQFTANLSGGPMGSHIALGKCAGRTNQGHYSVALGAFAGDKNQGATCIAIGNQSGEKTQGSRSVSIGGNSGYGNQGEQCVAIGYRAGFEDQPDNSIAIGANSDPLSEKSIQLKADTTTFDITPTEVLHNGQPIANQPCFYSEVSGGNLSVGNHVATKINFGDTTKRVDTHNLLDDDGTFTATAETAGIWRFSAQVSGAEVSGNHWLDEIFAMIYKNGSNIGEGTDSVHVVGGSYGKKIQTQAISIIVKVEDGDKFEVYGNISHSPDSAAAGSPLELQQRGTNFTGNRVSG